MATDDQVLAALATVRDPELDESIVALGFVAAVDTGNSHVHVRLRLPTYFCAPNFAWLMVADARAAVAALPGAGPVEVTLGDHFAAEEINAGVAAAQGFAATFEGLADDELDALRLTFRRKAFLARQERLARALLGPGGDPAGLGAVTLADLPPGADAELYLERRAELGLPCAPGDPFLVDTAGRPADPVDALRRGRTTRVSIEGNAGFCRGLLATRYPETERSPA
jgi:metal-sulfur cluster biosynthetic enzyme